MLDRIPAWLRHALIGLGASLISIALPLIVQHQEDLRDWIVNTLHLPLIVAPFIAAGITALVLRLTTLTRQYGTGSTTPPTVPVIDPNAEPLPYDSPGEVGHGMAGYSVIELAIGVLVILILVFVLLHIAG